jgi:hypothetical protein
MTCPDADFRRQPETSMLHRMFEITCEEGQILADRERLIDDARD